MSEEIIALCGAMGAGEGREELLIPLARAVEQQLAARLKDGTAPEDCGPAFPLAAAMMVMDRLSGMTGDGGSGEITSFTAGDLTIKKTASGSGRTAKSLSVQAEGLLAPWLEDAGFLFRGVGG